jgi:hypothetical protein
MVYQHEIGTKYTLILVVFTVASSLTTLSKQGGPGARTTVLPWYPHPQSIELFQVCEIQARSALGKRLHSMIVHNEDLPPGPDGSLAKHPEAFQLRLWQVST